MSAPSGWAIQQAISAWQSARARLLQDPDLDGDETALGSLLGLETADVDALMARLVSAAQHASAMAGTAVAQIEALDARKARYKARETEARATLFAMMDALGQRRFECAQGTVSVSAGRMAAVITDETAVPDRFVETVTTRKIKRTELLAALKDGEVIDGAELANGMPTITIRSK